MPFRAYTQLLSLVPIGATVNSSEQVSGLAKLINEYGTEVVIISVFLLIFIGIMTAYFKMLSKLVNNFLDQNKQLINAILGKEGIEKKDEKKKEDKTSDKKEDKDSKAETKSDDKEHNIAVKNNYINKIFDEVSRNVMMELHCDRVAIYAFHNGNKTPYGYSFVKMSCIHEHAMRGSGNSTSRGSNHQGAPLQAFSSIIDCLIRNGEYIVGNVYDHGIISADEQLLNFIDRSLVKALFCLAIMDDKSEPAGFVVAEFKNEQDFSNHSWYNKTRGALKTMLDAVRPVVIDNNFQAYFNKDKEAQ